MDSDALRSVRNAFYLGLYSEVAKEAQQLPKDNKEVQGQQQSSRGSVSPAQRSDIGRSLVVICWMLHSLVLSASLGRGVRGTRSVGDQPVGLPTLRQRAHRAASSQTAGNIP